MTFCLSQITHLVTIQEIPISYLCGQLVRILYVEPILDSVFSFMYLTQPTFNSFKYLHTDYMTSATRSAWVTDMKMKKLDVKNPYDICMTQYILDD